MRVLVSALSCSSGHGSEALVGFRYAVALSRRHAVTLFSSPPTEVPAGVRCVRIDAGPCNFNDVGAMAWVRFELGQWPRAWWRNRRDRFDVVHRVTPSSIHHPSLLARLGRPLVVGPLLASEPVPEGFAEILHRAQGPAGSGRLRLVRVAEGLAWRWRNRLAAGQSHLHRAAKILVGTRVAWQQVPDACRDRCVLIPYSGVEHDQFTPPVSRPQDGPVRVLYVGRLVPYKGLELLLRALAAAVGQADLRLRVVGTGHAAYCEYCRQLTASLGLQRFVEFVEAVPRAALVDEYQRADVFCFPTLCDTYGVALLEAMSCGCAVLVSDISGPGEIVPDGCGVKVAVHDPTQYVAEYAAALIRLASDRQQREQLGQQARQQILKHHDWDEITGRLTDVYDDLV